MLGWSIFISKATSSLSKIYSKAKEDAMRIYKEKEILADINSLALRK